MKKLSRVQRKKRRKKIFLTIIITGIIVLIFSMVIINSSFFSIDKINVVGNKNIKNNKIIETSSIRDGENIFKIKTKQAEENILSLPYVKNVDIERKIPKKIIINIDERKDKLRIKDVASFLILDREGYILNTVDDKNKKLTEITGLEIKNKIHGQNIFSNNHEKMKIKFIEKSIDLKALSKFKYIDMEDEKDINILTFGDIKVVFGSLNNVEYKLNLLDKVLKDIEEKKINAKMILMNKGENPIVVLEEEKETEEAEEE